MTNDPQTNPTPMPARWEPRPPGETSRGADPTDTRAPASAAPSPPPSSVPRSPVPRSPGATPPSGDRPSVTAAGWSVASSTLPPMPPGAGVGGASAYPSRPPVVPPPYAGTGGPTGPHPYGPAATHPATSFPATSFPPGSEPIATQPSANQPTVIQPSSRGPNGRRSTRRGVGAALAVAAVFAAGAGGVLVGRGLAGDSASATPATTATTTDVTPVSTTPGPVSPDATEPAAAVAEALSPAVVQIETREGLGSGFVYDQSGLIMTAAHVVDGASTVAIRLADGRQVEGEVLGVDDATDVGVVKIDPVDDLAVAELAVGVDLQVGQMAIAIGSPFGLDQSVTAGIVSALGRTTETPGGAIPAIQTDAPINSGNSGGALADRQGRVIGINSSIITGSRESSGNVGIGFAIPIDIAKVVADRIVAGESTVTGYLGVMGTDATGAQAGATIESIEGTPAAKAGLEAGDIITAVDEHQVSSMIDLVAQISTNSPGDEVTLSVVRDGEPREVTVTLGSAPGT